MRAIGRADSMSLDPHKWLFAPADAGCLLVRDAAALQRAFSTGAGYIDVIADQDMSGVCVSGTTAPSCPGDFGR